MARGQVTGYVIRYDAPVGPPVWAGKHTSTTRARGVLHPHVRSQGQAAVFGSREGAQAEVAARPRPERATVEKVVRTRRVRAVVAAASLAEQLGQDAQQAPADGVGQSAAGGG